MFSNGEGTKDARLYYNHVLVFINNSNKDGGLRLYDASTGKWINVMFRLIYTVSDTKAIYKLTGQTTCPNERCCHVCELRGEYFNELHTSLYDGAWRCLPLLHPYRTGANHPDAT